MCVPIPPRATRTARSWLHHTRERLTPSEVAARAERSGAVRVLSTTVRYCTVYGTVCAYAAVSRASAAACSATLHAVVWLGSVETQVVQSRGEKRTPVLTEHVVCLAAVACEPAAVRQARRFVHEHRAVQALDGLRLVLGPVEEVLF